MGDDQRHAGAPIGDRSMSTGVCHAIRHRTSMSERVLSARYLAWAATVIGIVLAKDGLTPDNITHLAILAYLAATAFAVPLLRRLAHLHPDLGDDMDPHSALRLSHDFTVLTSAGRAIGGGMSFFAANPAMFMFLPYVMLNYLAMTLAPYVAIRARIQDGRMRRGPKMFVLPLIVLPLVYGVVGTAIIVLGRTLGWIE